MTVWLDVEDIIVYARASSRLSGIQRLCFELYSALVEAYPESIGFLRHSPTGDHFVVTSWTEVRELFERLAYETRQSVTSTPVKASKTPLAYSALKRLVGRLPGEIREPAKQAVKAQMASISAGLRTFHSLLAALNRQIQKQAPESTVGQHFAALAKPGDMVCVFGSPWFRPDYGALLRKTKDQLGVDFVILVYDLIPIMRPDLVVDSLAQQFQQWYESCLPQASTIFTISRATAGEITLWAERSGLPLATTPQPIPIGTGFTMPKALPDVLPVGLTQGGYVLFVSTIEVRKNHTLAFRVWQKLLRDLPRDQVPQLVFVGRRGWMVADLMQQVENTHHLSGKLTIINDANDATLAALYQGCRFTLFPSHYEGWGLPVTESLLYGKVCIASETSSVPEAGGPFCLYIDPDNVTAATATIRRALEDKYLIEDMARKIKTEFSATPWSFSAEHVMRSLGYAK